MTLQEFKNQLQNLDTIFFKLPNETIVPPYFHITEIGRVTKNFIDCGGVLRKEEKASVQLWTANDFEHRLSPEKLINIINHLWYRCRTEYVTIFTRVPKVKIIKQQLAIYQS